MKKKVFYVTMAAIFAATSCTNELPNEQPTDVINIVASINTCSPIDERRKRQFLPGRQNVTLSERNRWRKSYC